LPSSSGPFQVSTTLNLATGALTGGNTLPDNCLYPVDSLFDSSTNTVLVTCFASGLTSATAALGEVVALNATTDAVTGTIGVGLGATAEALVATASGQALAVADTLSSGVTLVDPSTDLVIASFAVGADPRALAVDNATSEVYVANAGSANVSVINASSDRVVASVSVGIAPTSIVFDPAHGEVYVADSGSSTVTVIDATTNAVATTIGVGPDPAILTVDGIDNDVVVAATNASNVTVINASTNSVSSTWSVPDPLGLAVDPTTGTVYVTSGYGESLVGIDPSSGPIFETLLRTNATFALPFAVNVDPVNGEVYVDAFTERLTGSNLSVVFGGTEFAISRTTHSVNAQLTVGDGIFVYFEGFIAQNAFDPTSDRLFVAGSGSGNVSVIDGATEKVSSYVVLGVVPTGIAADPVNDELYVLNGVPGAVVVVNGANGEVVATVPVPGVFTSFIADDPFNGDVYVGGGFSPGFFVIGGSNHTFFTTIPNVTGPKFAFADPVNGQVYVEGSGAIYALNGVTNQLITSVSWGGGSGGEEDLAVDTSNGNLFAANGSTVQVLNASTDTFTGSITVGSGATALAFDAANGYVYVANSGSSDVSVIDGATNVVVKTIPVGPADVALSVDPVNGNIYVANAAANNSSVISGTTNTVVANVALGASPSGFRIDAATGDVFVGEPNMSRIGVIEGAGSPKLLQNVSVGIGLEGAVIDPATGALVTINELSGTLSFFNAGGPVYPVTFTESGLPSGTPWRVDLDGVVNGSTGGALTFRLPNGTFGFSVTSSDYAAVPPIGTVTISGTAASQSVTFGVRPLYPVTFSESGLRAGTSWSVTLEGVSSSTSGSTIVVEEPNGTYYFTSIGAPRYEVVPSNGSVVVRGAAPPVVTVRFTPEYVLTFQQSGLPIGDEWEVQISSTSFSYGAYGLSQNSTVVFDVLNGTYSWDVYFFLQGFLPSPSSGSVTVGGTNVTVRITFVPSYTVTFDASGLPIGSEWSATLAGSSQATSGPSLNFSEPNGSYAFTVEASGYAATPSSGNVTVAGAPVVQTVDFVIARGFYSITFGEHGSGSSGVYWEVQLYIEANHSYQYDVSTGRSIVFAEPNGTYNYSVYVFSAGYVPTPRNGTVTVAGANATVSIEFQPTYSVTFTETGLRSGADWSVTLNGSTESTTSTSLSIGESNGSYAFRVGATGYKATPASGNVTVSGAPVSEAIAFAISAGNYTVTFYETGLRSGSVSWGIDLSGEFEETSGTSIGFVRPNGSFAFSVFVYSSGFQPSPSSGTVTVNGTDVARTIEFQTLYSVTFTASGLATGAEWSVTLNGSTQYSNNTTLGFSEMNGSYPFTARSTGYTATPASGSVTVSGAPVVTPIDFALGPGDYLVRFNETGLVLAGEFWSVNLQAVPNGSYQSEESQGPSIAFAEPNGTYSFTVNFLNGYVASPASGTRVISGSNVSVAIAFSAVYSVTFTTRGLPRGAEWSVTLNGSTQSGFGTNLSFEETNGSYPFSVNATGYTATPSSGTAIVSGATVLVPIAFAIAPGYYSVSFREHGLPANGTSWEVVLAPRSSNGSSVFEDTNNSTVSFSEPNGTYQFAVYIVGNGFAPSPANGTVAVAGTNVTQAIAFLPTFSVTFAESGLPAGWLWSVTLNGSTLYSSSTSLSLREPNGTYAFTAAASGYVAAPSAGNLTVAGGPVNRSITFTRSFQQYSVTFTETGLPEGTAWNVTLNGTTLGSNTSSISFNETNGSYSFSVGAVAGFAASPESGRVLVSGGAVSLAVEFRPTYAVTFTESGLPLGTFWTVSLDGTIVSSSTARIVFAEPAGSYAFGITSVNGYTASPSLGLVNVSSGAVGVAITFTSVYTLSFTESGLPAGTVWSVSLNGVFTRSSPSSTIVFTEPNGTYSFTVGGVHGYVPNPSSGAVTVSGSPVDQATDYVAAPLYLLTFTESGLSSGTFWHVTLNWTSSSGVSLSSGGSSIVASEPNGTYWFSVSAASSRTASPAAGVLSVAGTGVTEPINFLPNYTVDFREVGLANGTAWWVDLNGVGTLSSSSASVTTGLTNGTYAFSVRAASGYSGAPAAGSVTVRGANVTVTVRFVLGTFNLTVRADDSRGGPIVGANVSVNGTSELTNASGMAAFALPGGLYDVVASASGYVSASQSIDLVSNTTVSLTLAWPFVFLGVIPSSDLNVTPTTSGYNISLRDVFSASHAWVFFDWALVGNLTPGSGWNNFSVSNLPSYIVLAAAPGSPDFPSAYYAYTSEPVIPPTDSGCGALEVRGDPFNPSISVSPDPPVLGSPTVLSVVLNNSCGVELNISQVDFEVSSITLGGGWTTVGIVENVSLIPGQIRVVSVIWNTTFNSSVVGLHHCVRVVVTYTPSDPPPQCPDNSCAIQHNFDDEPGLINGANGTIPFTLGSVLPTEANVTIDPSTSLPAGWSAELELNGAVYSLNAPTELAVSPGQVLEGTLVILPDPQTPGNGSVCILAYDGDQLYGGFCKTMQQLPPGSFGVKFIESGLNPGTDWSVTLNGSASSSTNAEIDFSEPNGTYAYSVGAVAGYTTTGSSGTVTVAGDTVTVDVVFSPVLYVVTFNETGLPSGVQWSISVQGGPGGTTTGTSISISLPNGSYNYSATTPDSAYASSGGSFVVDGAPLTVPVTFSALPPLTVSPTATHNPVDEGQSTTISAGASGGSGTYSSYRWTGLPSGCSGSRSSFRCVPAIGSAGNYTVQVTVTDSKGNTANGSFTLTVVPALHAGNSSAAPNPTQVGASTAISTSGASGGSGAGTYNYLWSGLPLNCSSTAPSFRCTPAQAGTFTVTLTVTDSNGGTATSTFTLTVEPALTASLDASRTTTQVGAPVDLTLGLANGVPGYTWTLTVNGGANLTGATQPGTYTFTPSLPGTYVFYLNATDSVGSTASSMVIVVVEPALTASLDATVTTTQVGEASVLTLGLANGVPGYTWTLTVNGGANLTGAAEPGTYTFTPSAAGTYTFYLNATDSVGSTASATVVVVVEPALTASLGADVTTTQVGGDSVLTLGLANGVPGYTWTLTVNGGANLTGATEPGTYTFSPSASGTYTFYLNATDSVGSTASALLVVVVEPALTASLDASLTTTQVGEASVLTLGLANGVPGYTWTLTVNGGTNLSGATEPGTYTFTASAPGSYTFNLSATDSVGSTDSDTVTVVVEPALVASLTAGVSTLDAEQPTTLTIGLSGGVAPISWTFQRNGSASNITGASGGTYSFTPLNAGTYTFYLNATDQVGSVVRVTSVVTVKADPTVGVTPVGPLTYDRGQSAGALTATLTYSGPNTLTVSWYSSSTSSCASTSTATGSTGTTYTPGTASVGTTYYCAVVTDSGVSAYTSASNAVKVTTIQTYSVTFTSTGLPVGTQWSVTLNGATGHSRTTSIVFNETNGTYGFSVGTVSGYTATPTSGTLKVQGSPASRLVAFAAIPRASYPVTFNETGLPAGTEWWVNLTGETPLNSTGTTITTSLPNGTHPYSIADDVRSWQVVNQSGNVTVAGTSPPTVDVSFVYAYSITAVERDLPGGTGWNVNVLGTLGAGVLVQVGPASSGLPVHYEFSSLVSTLLFSLPNGTYTYRISSTSSSWTPNNATGSETVDGGASAPTLATTFSSRSSPATILGIPQTEFFLLVFGLVAVIAIAGIVVGLRRRPPSSAAPSTPPGSGDPGASSVEPPGFGGGGPR